MAPPTGQPPARLLDLSRLASRLGRGPATGIDRVERAYLAALAVDGVPLSALVRTGAGYCLLDRDGALALAALDGLPQPDLLARLTRPGDARAAAADTAVRRLAHARAAAPFLGAMLRRHLPPGTRYLNVGHSNLSPRVLAAVHSLPGARVAVFVHDTIPLDHPDLSRPDRVAVFDRRMRAVSAGADLVICNSADTAARATHWLGRFGRAPPVMTAPLGVSPAAPDPAGLPPGLPGDRPFFLVLGTIEPRKNHALLLDVWGALAARLPPDRVPLLVVAGSRGWAAPALFARLDAAVRAGHAVEAPGLGDGAVAALLARTRALLFPSLAEGFGLPLAEAMAAGAPVVCTPLPAFREIAGDYPVYLDASDVYAWADEVGRRSADGGQAAIHRQPAPPLPTWSAHFNFVLSAT